MHKSTKGTEPGADLGPVISKQVKERISKLIQAIVDSGAKLVLDGRQVAVSKYELGNFIGPPILSDIKEDIECSKEELLGPVLLCMQVCPMFLGSCSLVHFPGRFKCGLIA